MNRKNERFQFDIAKPGDGPEILAILEETDFKGRIGLVYTRRPDPYRSFHLEGKDTVVAVCRDTRENKIVGFGAFTIRKVFVNGEVMDAGYLFGLRARREYQRKYPLLGRGYKFIEEMIVKRRVPYVLTTILEENRYTQQLLEKKRPFMPDYVPLTLYGTFIFKTGGEFKIPAEFSFKRADTNDLSKILTFINTQGKQKQFYTVLGAPDLASGLLPGLRGEDFWVLYDHQNEIAACGALWNQQGYKQYLIKEYGGVLKLVRPLTAVLKLLGFPPLPKPGSVLNFCTLSFWAIRGDDPVIFETYLKLVAAGLKNYPFFVMGCSFEHPLHQRIKRASSLSFSSQVYLVDWAKDGETTELDRSLPVYLECGLL
jgi:hypothetical protein